ncbi:MAG TPA: class I SAM-dependent methyltransferase [Blastocatellia bacterium]|nr:class I SAM-dependent methyltransferase [Blastocatellia bacterium]
MNIRHALRNCLLSFNYLHPAVMAVALRRGPRAVKPYLSEMYRCSKTDAGLYMPVVTLEQIAAETTEFVVYRQPDWGGSMTITEISSLCYLVAARSPRKVLEIGTFRGLTTLNIAMNAPRAEVHTLDLPPDADPNATKFSNNDAGIITRRDGYYYAERAEAARIRQHYGDTALFDFTRIGAGIDFCLIDAAHSYEYVRNDTARVLPWLTDDCLMLWHDYGRNDFMADADDSWGVTRFLHEIADVGVAVLQGTSLGVLKLSRATRQEMANRLGVELGGRVFER